MAWRASPRPAVEEDGWLLTYLDVMTLLLVMMVVLLAFARPSSAPDAPSLDASSGTGRVSAPGGDSLLAAVKEELKKDELLAKLDLQGLGDDVKVIAEGGVVRFRIHSEILFSSGQAEIVGAGGRVLYQLLPVFERAPDHIIVVEGHTDNIPMRSERFPSNWELSTARASSVVRYLVDLGVDPSRLRATGYADTRPLASNATEAGQAENRRVELLLETERGGKR